MRSGGLGRKTRRRQYGCWRKRSGKMINLWQPAHSRVLARNQEFPLKKFKTGTLRGCSAALEERRILKTGRLGNSSVMLRNDARLKSRTYLSIELNEELGGSLNLKSDHSLTIFNIRCQTSQ